MINPKGNFCFIVCFLQIQLFDTRFGQCVLEAVLHGVQRTESISHKFNATWLLETWRRLKCNSERCMVVIGRFRMQTDTISATGTSSFWRHTLLAIRYTTCRRHWYPACYTWVRRRMRKPSEFWCCNNCPAPLSLCDAIKFASHEAFAESMNRASYG